MAGFGGACVALILYSSFIYRAEMDWLFWITIAFSVVYLVVYPGVGKVQGVFGWTSAGQLPTRLPLTCSKRARQGGQKQCRASG